MTPIARPTARRLNFKDPRLVTNYHTRFKQKAIATQLLQKVRELEGLVTYPPSELLIKKYEEIDKIWCDIVKYAESKCRKLKMGQVAFSPEVGDARRVLSAWTQA